MRETLTPAEARILPYVAAGWQYTWIADHLCYAPSTVKDYTIRILRKLFAATRTEAMLYALRAGLIDLDATYALMLDGLRRYVWQAEHPETTHEPGAADYRRLVSECNRLRAQLARQRLDAAP